MTATRRSEAMFGWRGRIGLIVPSSNSAFELEMKAMCPAGVKVYATRVAFTADEQRLKGSAATRQKSLADLAAEGLSNIIVLGYAVGSMLEGKGNDDKICAEINVGTGIPAIATTTAVIAACKRWPRHASRWRHAARNREAGLDCRRCHVYRTPYTV